MNHAELHLCPGEDSLNCLSESGEVVNTGDEHVAQSSVGEIGENTQPELRTFRLADVESQEFLVTVLVESYDAVNCTRNHAALMTHCVVNGIKPYKWVHRLQ